MESITIGIIGDYREDCASHQATNEALRHGAEHLGIRAEVHWLPTESLESGEEERLRSFDGFWCAPGSPYKSMEGALRVIRFARENDYPFIGTCGGFQHAVIEYARNRLGLLYAQHAEYEPNASELIITPLSCSLMGETRSVLIRKDSQAFAIYGCTEAEERFTCSFGINPKYQEMLDDSGFHISGAGENGEARIMELRRNRFFIATLFQPQLSSTPEMPHKLVTAYLACAKEFQSQGGKRIY